MKANKSIAIIGRFQPFHLGHLALAKFAHENYRTVIIVIGSANRNYEVDNPFTYDERCKMIEDSLNEENIKAAIIGADDQINNVLWAMNVLAKCRNELNAIRLEEKYETDYLVDVPNYGNAKTVDLVACARKHQPMFRDLGVETQTLPRFKRDNYRGTNIRRILIENGFKNPEMLMVPAATARVISDIHGVERLLDISEKE